jgi:hypothetical protein
MEPHRELGTGTEDFRPDLNAGAKAYFDKAWKFTQKFYGKEVRQISSVRFSEVTPEHFFAEYTWVVHATGFSAKAVGKFMPKLVNAYGPWTTLGWTASEIVVERVRKVVNNPQKISAVHAMAGRMVAGVKAQDWTVYRNEQLSTPEKLAKLPYIGKVTCFHLGRNIGLLDCVKPDLHLIRMAKHWGFKTCEEMCRAVQPKDVPLGIVDLAFWYAASTFGTLELRKEGER